MKRGRRRKDYEDENMKERKKGMLYDKRKEACCAFGSDEVMLIYMHLVLKFSEIFSVHNV